jgi:hypothetical protein
MHWAIHIPLQANYQKYIAQHDEQSSVDRPVQVPIKLLSCITLDSASGDHQTQALTLFLSQFRGASREG